MAGPLDLTFPPDGDPGGSSASVANTPAIKSATTALAANPSRVAWHIQNLGTNPLFVRFGAGASTILFHVVLRGGTGANDGLGGVYEQSQGVYTGVITIAGTAPSYTVLET